MMRAIGIAALVLALAFTYAPSLWLVFLSLLSSRIDLFAGGFTLSNYRDLFTDLRWLAPLGESVLIAVPAAIVATVLGLFAGRAAGRHRHGALLLAICLVPAIVPGVVMGASLFAFLRAVLGLRLGAWSIGIAQVLWALPFCTTLFFLRYRRFDPAWIDAAATLGVGPGRAFFRVELPIVRATIGSALLFGFILAFTELARSVFLRGTTTTLPIFQWAQAASHTSQAAITFGLSSLVLLLTTAVIVPLIFRQQRAS